jgi:hypothetical protein
MQYPIGLTIEYSEKHSRLTTFFRSFMTIPQYFILFFMGIAAGVVMFISWWAILFTGKFPKSLFDFIERYLRWYVRVEGYAAFLTDKYPPYNGEP